MLKINPIFNIRELSHLSSPFQKEKFNKTEKTCANASKYLLPHGVG